MFTVINKNGKEIYFDGAVMMMDDEIREDLNISLGGENGEGPTEQELFTAYEIAHEEKFEEEWELSKVNPVW